MTTVNLEYVMSQLWAQITPLIQVQTLAPTTALPFAFGSRRFQLWADVPAANKPAIFLHKPKMNSVRPDDYKPAILTINANIWIYVDAADQSVVPDTAMNNLFQKVWDVLSVNNPTGTTFLIPGTQARLRIDGEIITDSGDLDNNGVMLIPLKILIPNF